jgi:hypothetical protein
MIMRMIWIADAVPRSLGGRNLRRHALGTRPLDAELPRCAHRPAACEARNLFLDRALLVETMAEPGAAFLISCQAPDCDDGAGILPGV